MLLLSELFLRDISFNMKTSFLPSFVLAVFAAGPMFAQSFIPELLLTEGTSRTLVDFNSPAEDFSAVPISKEELVFVSSRKGPNSRKKDPETNQYFFDLYVYNRATKEVHALFSEEGKNPIASKFNLGPVSYIKGSEIVVSRNNLIPNKDGIVTFNLTSINISDPSTAKILSFVKKDYSYLHPFYDAKSERLYFSSNERGGKGGFDLYYSERLLDGGWGPAIPLTAVNTSRDEVFPTVAPNGTILFSKVVPKQGLNIFAYEIKSNQIQELSSPFNTSLDDFGIVFDTPHSAYISQSQSGRYNTDIVRLEGPQYNALVARGELPALTDFGANAQLPSNKVAEESQTYTANNIVANVDLQNVNNSYTLANEKLTKSIVDQSAIEKVSSISTISDGVKSKEINVEKTDSLYNDVSRNESAVKRDLISTRQVNNSTKNAETYSQQLNSLTQVASSLSAEVDNGKEQIAGFERSILLLKAQLESLDPSSAKYSSIRDSLLLQIVDLTTQRNRANADYNVKLNEMNAVNQERALAEAKLPLKSPSISNYPDITNQWGSPDLVLLFGFDKSMPLNEYRLQLAAVLKELPKTVTGAFVVGHADSRGAEPYNFNLSKRRAISVQKLLGKSLKVQTKGYGESHLKNECGNGVICPEIQHLQNRRVEIWFY